MVEDMKIKIYCIGKIKEPYLKSGISEYLTRLQPYCNLEIIEVADEPIKDNPNSSSHFAGIYKLTEEIRRVT